MIILYNQVKVKVASVQMSRSRTPQRAAQEAHIHLVKKPTILWESSTQSSISQRNDLSHPVGKPNFRVLQLPKQIHCWSEWPKDSVAVTNVSGKIIHTLPIRLVKVKLIEDFLQHNRRSTAAVKTQLVSWYLCYDERFKWGLLRCTTHPLMWIFGIQVSLFWSVFDIGAKLGKLPCYSLRINCLAVYIFFPEHN